jgi:hypothetical protein
MDRSTIWRAGRALLLGTAIIAVTSTLAATVPTPGTSIRVALATVAQGKNDDKKDKNKQNESDDEDHVLNGQVLEINTLKNPPELIVGSVDGQTVIRVLKTDEIATNGVHLGDYVQANGEKQDETLFEATQLSISERFKGETASGNNNNNDNKKKKN